MTINLNLNGKDRKYLVELLSQITESRAKYLGVPSCAYQVSNFTVGRYGELTFDENLVSKEEIFRVLDKLREQGFESEVQSEETELTIEMPREILSDAALENLKKLIEAKGNLIKKALGADSLLLETDEEKISFPWFSCMPEPEEIKAYTEFVSKLCEMAQNQKRITSKEKEVENDKYAFRCFLLRLGFIGSEYKEERRILLKNLSGSSAFKGGSSDEDK